MRSDNFVDPTGGNIDTKTQLNCVRLFEDASENDFTWRTELCYEFSLELILRAVSVVTRWLAHGANLFAIGADSVWLRLSCLSHALFN